MENHAGLSLRTKAFATDLIGIMLFLGINTGLIALVNISTNIVQELFSNRILAQVSVFLLVTLPVTLYYAVSEASSYQATYGKRMMRLKVVDRNGNQIGILRSLARAFLKFIPWELSHTLIWEICFDTGLDPTLINVGFVVVYVLVGLNMVAIAMSKTKQSLYDLLTGTYVVRSEQ